MYFPTKFLKLSNFPTITLKGVNVEFVSKVKYLGITIRDNLSDDSDTKAWVKSIYCTANMLCARFFKCLLKTKNCFATSFL